jgi:hypothetical protein
MKRLYERGGDIINDFMPTGAVGGSVKNRNSMLQNNSQVDTVKNSKLKQEPKQTKKNR